MFTWVISNSHLQLSDPCHCPVRRQAVHQGIMGYQEAAGRQLKVRSVVRSVCALRGQWGRRGVWDVGQEHTAW